jgi:tRNA-2-methylthio-N6-dimethylallyladenosine synthase
MMTDSPTDSQPAAGEPKVFFHTFGCQMNDYDTSKMRARLAGHGYNPTEDPAEADLILLNTCSIREKAVDKMHSALGRYRRLKRQGQPVVIGVAGCVAQMEGNALLERYPDLDLVFGPDAVGHVTELVAEARAGSRVLDTEFLDLENYPFVADVDATQSGVGAFVTIQKGCDNRCTFCIVPTTRGDEASRPSAEVLAEIAALTALGVSEITLIGQNVNSYGLKVDGEQTFAQLLYAVAEVPGVERIRYTTSHPRDMGEDVVQAYADLEKLTSHLHLPVQSGSNRVLRRMKRFYTCEHYLRVVDKLRAARPDIVLTTDFIAGFPGETDEDFEETMALLDAVGFVGSFSFKYSPRPGTPALRLDEHLPDAVAGERLTRLQNRQRQLSRQWAVGHEGSVQRVLVEGPSRHGEGVVCGRTSTNLPVNFAGPLSLVGELIDIRIIRGLTHSCRGEIV